MFTLWVQDEQQRGPYNHMTTARKVAVSLAAELSEAVEVCTHDAKTGRRRIRTIIHPEGRAAPPPGMEQPEREGCVAHEGRACFCTPCRAARKARRG